MEMRIWTRMRYGWRKWNDEDLNDGAETEEKDDLLERV